MKNLIIAALIFSCTLAQAQITQTIVHETGGNTNIYQLSDLDSIVYDSLNVNMIIHEAGGNTVSYPISNVDSCTYKVGCPPSFSTMTDSRDGEVYQTVTICNQTWMAENLRYDVPGVFGGSDTINSANPSTTYGRLYDWATMMNGSSTSSSNPSGVQGICPSGWHLPSDAEWNEMEKALGMSEAVTANTGWRGTDHGTKMKSLTGWSSNGNWTNASGFNAFPAGYYGSGSFTSLGDFAFFWSSTESSGSHAWDRELNNGNATVYRGSNQKIYGFSCRCVRN
jgi:uncharacterized protein (TIGR02145 family)